MKAEIFISWVNKCHRLGNLLNKYYSRQKFHSWIVLFESDLNSDNVEHSQTASIVFTHDIRQLHVTLLGVPAGRKKQKNAEYQIIAFNRTRANRKRNARWLVLRAEAMTCFGCSMVGKTSDTVLPFHVAYDVKLIDIPMQDLSTSFLTSVLLFLAYSCIYTSVIFGVLTSIISCFFFC